jgi:hypothetical protein
MLQLNCALLCVVLNVKEHKKKSVKLNWDAARRSKAQQGAARRSKAQQGC